MTKLLDFLAQTKVILICFVLMMIIGAGFSFAPRLVGGELLDMQMNAADAAARLAEMNGGQKSNHIWLTLILDSLYPLAYGGFFAGIAARFSGSWRKFTALPALATIIVDFTENFVQVLALSGSTNLLGIKDIITPVKFGGFILAALIALLLLVIALVKWIQRK